MDKRHAKEKHDHVQDEASPSASLEAQQDACDQLHFALQIASQVIPIF